MMTMVSMYICPLLALGLMSSAALGLDTTTQTRQQEVIEQQQRQIEQQQRQLEELRQRLEKLEAAQKADATTAPAREQGEQVPDSVGDLKSTPREQHPDPFQIPLVGLWSYSWARRA